MKTARNELKEKSIEYPAVRTEGIAGEESGGILSVGRRLRNVYRFEGYIHVKAIPGADAEVIYRLGLLVDRMSVNLELPTAEGLRKVVFSGSNGIFRPDKGKRRAG